MSNVGRRSLRSYVMNDFHNVMLLRRWINHTTVLIFKKLEHTVESFCGMEKLQKYPYVYTAENFRGMYHVL